MIPIERLRAHLGGACARVMLRLQGVRVELSEVRQEVEVIVAVRGRGEDRNFIFPIAARDAANNTDEFWATVCAGMAERMEYEISERAIEEVRRQRAMMVAPPVLAPPPERQREDQLRQLAQMSAAGVIPKEKAMAIYEAVMKDAFSTAMIYGQAVVRPELYGAAAGADTNVGMTFGTKGAGAVNVMGGAPAAPSATKAAPRKPARTDRPQLEFEQGRVDATPPQVPELDL